MNALPKAQPRKPKLHLPLYSKILLWFIVNLLVLALLGFGFLKAEFKLGLDWMLSGEPGERISAIGESVTHELSRLPESEWQARLRVHDEERSVVFGLFNRQGMQVHGAKIEIPNEVLPKLIDRRPAGENSPRRLPGPISKRPADAPPKPRFMMRAGTPARYWAGIHLDLVQQDGKTLTLVMASDTISGGGLFFDLRPWLGLIVAALLISGLIWMPFVRGISGFIRGLNEAAGRIAHGKFDERITRVRHDELGELATSVNAMAAQLGDYVAQQRRITADVAHELCSPIARMQMALGVVELRSTPDQEAYLKKLDNELQHMAKLVEEVLAFSKAETLPEREAPENILLRELIHEVMNREAPDIEIKLEVDDLQIHTLRSALDRALGNVLRNAVRYASDIEIHAKTQDGQITIQILDQGLGVPPETLPRLFEPFYRPEAARGRNTGGSGLGLAIVKRCIEACGGTVAASLRKPIGLEILIRIPLVQQ